LQQTQRQLKHGPQPSSWLLPAEHRHLATTFFTPSALVQGSDGDHPRLFEDYIQNETLH